MSGRSVKCKVYIGYHGKSEIETGLCACTIDNPFAKARGLSLRTGAQTMFYLSFVLTFKSKSGLEPENSGEPVISLEPCGELIYFYTCTSVARLNKIQK